MEWLSSIQIDRELIPNLLAILGLLMTWELHDIGVRSGRIKPRNISDALHIFDLSSVERWIKSHAGVHMYIHMTPNDDQACEACRQASGKVFSPTALKNKKFKPLDNPCRNANGCRCHLIGLIGNWPEAEQLWRSLDGSPEGIMLSDQELADLLQGATTATGGTAQDRVNLYMVEALHAERLNSAFAMSRYRSLIRHAAEGYQHHYVVPAYMRLSELLERSGNFAAALKAVDDFAQHAKSKACHYGPTHRQKKLMALRRVRLLKLLNAV